MAAKVISRDFIEINPGEVIEQVTISENCLFWKSETTYRKVHGEYFIYHKERYTAVNRWTKGFDVRSYFNLPIE